MIRCALYARYSSDLQREASIEDQLRICGERAAREGWHVVGSFTDAGLSGASLARPGYRALLTAMRAGEVDVVLAESLDRFSRDQEHIAGFHKQACFAGIRVLTLAEGEISELHVGLKGTMGALYLKDLADKTRRGIQGRILKGRAIGRVPYGYRVARGPVDRDGEPERGLRAIEPGEAAVVQRIFRAYAAGSSPRAIARALNAEGVPGPAGGAWYSSTIRGKPRKDRGILRNDLYAGRLVWNRRRGATDPQTGMRRTRANEPGQVVAQDVPELCIIDDALWLAVQQRLALDAAPRRDLEGHAFWQSRRPRYLLTGKVFCGACARTFHAVGRDYLGCSAATQGACRNTCRMRRSTLQDAVLRGLAGHLMQPDLLQLFIDELTAEWRRLASEATATHATTEREIARLDRQIDNLVAALADGSPLQAVRAKLQDLEAARDRLVAGRTPAPAMPDWPDDLAIVYRERLRDLSTSLTRPDDPEPLTAARALIDKVIVSPPDSDNDPPDIELVGALKDLLKLAGLSTGSYPTLGHLVSSLKERSGASGPWWGAGAKPLLGVRGRSPRLSAPAPPETPAAHAGPI